MTETVLLAASFQFTICRNADSGRISSLALGNGIFRRRLIYNYW